LKRTPLRKVSSKRRKLMDEVREARQEYLREHPYCACCNERSVCVHEIASGSARNAALSERCAWLATCWLCNLDKLTDYSVWPIARQLAAKAIQDPRYYSKGKVCELRGRDPNAIDDADVIRAARTISVRWMGE